MTADRQAVAALRPISAVTVQCRSIAMSILTANIHRSANSDDIERHLRVFSLKSSKRPSRGRTIPMSLQGKLSSSERSKQHEKMRFSRSFYLIKTFARRIQLS